MDRSATLSFLLEAPNTVEKPIQIQLDREFSSDGGVISVSGREWPKVLMIEGRPMEIQLNLFQEGIAEEGSDDEEEEQASRARKGKIITEEDVASLVESQKYRPSKGKKEAPFE